MARHDDWDIRRRLPLIDRIYWSIRSFIVNLVGWAILGVSLVAIAIGLSRLL